MYPGCRYQLIFDDYPLMTLRPEHLAGQERAFEPWPGDLRQYLDGKARLVIRTNGTDIDLGEVRFGTRDQRLSFLDSYGVPIVIDKWGLAQRPFSNRDPAVARYMAEFAERMVDVVRRDTGIEMWLAFGTLLGAVRAGTVIPHDSDVDLAYYSEADTPAAMAVEMYRIKRALTDDGIRVIAKSGSFLTALFEAPDGAPASIDIYTTFHLEGLLYETATVRAPVPREAVLPLGRMDFEGRSLPVPHDVDAMLSASYGPGWRSPDPGFTHEPGPEHNARFDGWFGNLMRQRREWEICFRRRRPEEDNGSDFRSWVRERIPADAVVFDVGLGIGEDAVAFAREGHVVRGLDYARNAGLAIREVREEFSLQQLMWRQFNLYDERDVLTLGALWGRTPGSPHVVYARSVLDAVSPEFTHLLRTMTKLLAPGADDRVFLEFDEVVQQGSEPVRFHQVSGRQFVVRLDEERAAWERAGARVLEVQRFTAPRPDQPGLIRCRMVMCWRGAASAADDGEELE